MTDAMMVMISQELVDAMLAAARQAAPHECCGLLVGGAGAGAGAAIAIETAIHTPNVSATPHAHFEIDPAILIDANRVHRQRLIGHYHSHPSGDAMPSATDTAHAHEAGKIWIIMAGETLSAFICTTPHHFADCQLVVRD